MRVRAVSRRWLELEMTSVPHSTRPWMHLGASWAVFLVTAGVYYVPATLLGGHCPKATIACSIADELDLSPALQGWLPAIFLLCKGILAIPAGIACQKRGPKFCIAAGVATLTASAVLFTLASGYYQLVLVYIAYGATYSFAGLMPLIVFINGWFGPERKGISVGLLVTGFSAAGVFWPPLVGSIAEVHGWRAAAMLLPVASLFLALPIATLMLRDGRISSEHTPELSSVELAQNAASTSSTQASIDSAGDGLDATICQGPSGSGVDAANSSQVISSGSSCLEVQRLTRPRSLNWFRDPVAWHLAAMSFEVLYVIGAVVHLLVQFLCSEEVGASLTYAGMLSSLVSALSLAGKVLFGAAIDRSSHRRLIAMCGCALLALGSAMVLQVRGIASGAPLELIITTQRAQLVAFAVCFGLGYGCSFTLVQSRAAALYGHLDSFSRLQSYLAVCQYAGSFSGVVLTSLIREATGSFVRPFCILILLSLLACFHCRRLFPPQAACTHPSAGNSAGHNHG